VKAGSAITADQTFPCACAGKESEIEAADAARRLAADNELMPITKVAKMA
jgi:hypothetical protein